MKSLLPATSKGNANTRPRRLCVFAHYDQSAIVDPHVQYLLAGLRTVCDQLIFVSTSAITPSYLDSLALPISKAIIRQNVGFDFYGWKLGLEAMPLGDFEEIVLCNDSVYGPLFPLAEVFEEMSRRRCDFWGITHNLQSGYHVQSYFLVFKTAVIRSVAFKSFWDTVGPLDDKQAVILRYELGLTASLMNERFVPDAYFKSTISDVVREKLIALRNAYWIARNEDTKRFQTFRDIYISKRTLNKTIYFWREMLDRKAPFLKVALLKYNPNSQEVSEILRAIGQSTSYPVPLILDHQQRVRHG